MQPAFGKHVLCPLLRFNGRQRATARERAPKRSREFCTDPTTFVDSPLEA
jgi:hypothetical protein